MAGGVAKITLTGKVGPAQSVTTLVLNGVTSYTVDCINNTITAFGATPGPLPGPQVYDIAAATTWTQTIASGVYTITIS